MGYVWVGMAGHEHSEHLGFHFFSFFCWGGGGTYFGMKTHEALGHQQRQPGVLGEFGSAYNLDMDDD